MQLGFEPVWEHHATAAISLNWEEFIVLFYNRKPSVSGAGRWMIGAAAAASLLAMGLAPAHAESRDELYEAAKKEGAVVLWSANDAEAIQKMAVDFQKTYPGIEIQHFEIEPGPAIQRLVAEAQAGQVNVDLFDTLLSYLQPALQRDLIQPYDWPSFGVKSELTFYDNKCIDYYHLDVPLAYNTTMVKEGEIKSWDDLLDPKWKGQVVLEARGLGLAILAEKWGDEKVDKFIDALKANDALIIKGGTPTAEALAGGQAAIAIGTYAGKMERYKQMGAPVAWSTVGPVPAMNYVLCIPKNAKHSNAARLFTWWLTTREGQDSLWRHQLFGRAVGENLSPVGEAYKKAGTEVVLEARDPAINQQRLKRVAARIGGL
jgi:iron(III) transport system substrate-binding protein